MRNLIVKQTHEMQDGRVLVWVETPEDMQGFSQAQAKAELYEKIVRLELFGEEKNYLVRGFEMMGYPDRIVENSLGLMVRKKEPPISQCTLKHKK